MDNFLGANEQKIQWESDLALYPLPRASYSQLNCFLNCPHEFFLNYMQGYREREGNKYTELGSLLHAIFEKQGKQLIAEKPMTHKDALMEYNKGFMAIDRKHFSDKEDFKAMYKKGTVAIENYWFEFGDKKPLYLEKEFIETIGEGIPLIKGFVDRIDGDPEDASSWTITDYKTGSNPKSKDYLRKDFQLAIYAMQVKAKYGAYPRALRFYHPVPDKFQLALHQGDGVYKFTNQRNPVVEFSVADKLIVIRGIIHEIAECVRSGNWEKKIDSWGCKNCFKFNECKPFNEIQQGWSGI